MLVSLLTDFGTRDGYVGAMKGEILRRAPGAQVIDITHDIGRHDIAAGAYALATSTSRFPSGAIHVAVVDPGVGSDRAAVVYRARGHVFIAPDNGILDLVRNESSEALRIENREFMNWPISATFHGRDVFASCAGALAAGARVEDVGPVMTLARAAQPRADRIVHVDVFGNLISNTPCEPMTPGSGWIEIGGQRVACGTTYADVEPGELIAYRGSAGTIEIAVREGSAAELLGLGVGASFELREESV